ncbi:MFS transporter [Kitasatospora viridis]|uniref:Putative MFS family arabinose efflux permease n=1 Tax=Kitasatospora viridis TaxID=281105 RepID=A0A561TTB5_9ACTN|nr:MFS transporter [Kitasatospora viridis]TWF90337.1 putative MFS family arabinose efflux permease [Kitasatospora viridis]
MSSTRLHATTPDADSGAAAPGLSRPLILLLALTCGVAVSTIYFPQAVSPLIAHDLGLTPGAATLVVTAAQLGYAAGVFLFVPLGDRLPPRPLITTLLAISCVGLLAAGLAPSVAPLLAASAMVGLTTVSPQIIIPLAAGRTAPERRGAVTGTLLSGLLGGILLARTFSGVLGQWFGWRAPYLVAAALIAVLAAVLFRVLPGVTSAPALVPAPAPRYLAMLGQSVQLLRAEPLLRRSCLYQIGLFGGFSAAWTSLALLVTGPVYHLGPSAVGVLALVGAGSMFASPVVGRLADRSGPDRVNRLCSVGAILAALVLCGGRSGGAWGLIALGAGLLLLDVAVQSNQVANQARIFGLRPEIRSRLNSAYMTCAFLGGSAGSWVGARASGAFGWLGVCALVAALAAVVLVRQLTTRPVSTRPAPAVG